jgi:hypothetical protein
MSSGTAEKLSEIKLEIISSSQRETWQRLPSWAIVKQLH